jgi:hypothetical protein
MPLLALQKLLLESEIMETLLAILRNIKISLTAVGPAAVLIVLILSVTALGIFGTGPLADRAMSFMYVLSGMLGVSLASRS